METTVINTLASKDWSAGFVFRVLKVEFWTTSVEVVVIQQMC